MRELKTGMGPSDPLPRRRWARPVGVVLVGSLVLVGCAGGQENSEDDGNAPDQQAEQTMTSDNETTEEAAGSGGA